MKDFVGRLCPLARVASVCDRRVVCFFPGNLKRVVPTLSLQPDSACLVLAQLVLIKLLGR